jgi:hypothetical protein
MDLDDKRLVKMVLETAQMLSTAAILNGGVGCYKRTHENHPCVKWAACSRGNYKWLLRLFDQLAAEYSWRFHRVHKSHAQHCATLIQMQEFIPEGAFSEPPAVVKGREGKTLEQQYQRYLQDKWDESISVKWTNRQPPKWRKSTKLKLGSIFGGFDA